ncbi:MAG: M50 family metallopeptidase [Clostridia bacterium]|nr:M50 family metallopeptidase [Clostridia bacterium]
MKNNEKKKKSRLLGLILPLLVGVVFGVVLAEYGSRIPDVPGLGIASFAFMVLAIFAQIAIHEAGHLVFGLATGYKFCSYRLFGFMVQKSNGRLVFKRFKLAGTGGQCLLIPPALNGGRYKSVLYHLGGVIMNLLSSAIFAILLCISGSYFVDSLCVMMIVFGVLFALVNGIPMTTQNIDNDGKNAIYTSKSPKASTAMWIQLSINAMQADGKRLKDMPDEWFVFPDEADMNNGLIASLAAFCCNRLMDQGRLEECEREIERIISLDSALPGIYKMLLRADLISLYLLLDRDFDKVSALFDKEQESFMKTMKDFPSIIRTQYIYARLGEHSDENSEKQLARFENIAKSYPFIGDIESEREIMSKCK